MGYPDNDFGPVGDDFGFTDPTSRVRKELQPGEQLLWLDQPRPGPLRPLSIFVGIFGLAFAGFALFWMGLARWMVGRMAGGMGLPGFLGWVVPMFGLPFLFIGLAIVASPIRARKKLATTIYALTNQRLLVISGTAASLDVRSFGPSDLGRLRRVERADGAGDLYFAETSWTDTDGHVRRSEVALLNVPDVQKVERLIRENLTSDPRDSSSDQFTQG